MRDPREVQVIVARDVDVSADQAFAMLTDWPAQGRWMPGTHVEVSAGPTEVGTRIAAFTGVGPLGFLDTMEVTGWDPPRRCEVLHTGRLVRGPGVFVVQPLGPDRARVRWEEHLELPFGALGVLGWPIVRHPVRWSLQWALARFARHAERASR